MPVSPYQQVEYDIRCEWGLQGVANLAALCDVVIIVDVLSFSTCIDIAVARGALVYPYQWQDGSAEDFAAEHGAILAAAKRTARGYTLSPTSLVEIAPGTRLVLPSPNGSTLSLATGDKPTFAGCLRNAQAVAEAAQSSGKKILVVPAGERWPDGSMRPALEDLIGAGAIISHMTGHKSPEARAAEAVFPAAGNLYAALSGCGSGKELIGRGFEQDVYLASLLNASQAVPVIADGAYVAAVK